MGLLSSEQAAAVEQAIARVENRSATELVVAIVERSDDYVAPRALVTFGWTLALALSAAFFLPALPPWWLVPLELPLAALLYALFSWPPLCRRLIPRERAEQAVQARAYALFAERGLHGTRERTGLLILLSELEHRVVILGDSGIHALVGESGWREHVDRIVARIHEGRAAEGVLETIAVLEPLLEQHAPRRADDQNELANTVVRG
jgi:putative membrane protein